MKKIKAVIFDFDGVIVETTLPGMNIMKEIALYYNLTVPNEGFFKKHWGESLDVLWRSIVDDLGWPDCFEKQFLCEFAAKDANGSYYINTKVSSVLSKMKKEFGLEMAIVSNRRRVTFNKVWPKLGFEKDIFFHIQVGDDCQYKKPDVRSLNAVFGKLAKLDISLEECVYIGDTIIADLALALNCQPELSFIGVASGAVDKDDFCKEIGDEHVIDSILDLPARLKQLGWVKNGKKF